MHSSTGFFFLALLTVIYCENDTLVTKKIAWDIDIGDKKAGTIVMGVFGNVAPKTVANFVALASHQVSWQNGVDFFISLTYSFIFLANNL